MDKKIRQTEKNIKIQKNYYTDRKVKESLQYGTKIILKFTKTTFNMKNVFINDITVKHQVMFFVFYSFFLLKAIIVSYKLNCTQG